MMLDMADPLSWLAEHQYVRTADPVQRTETWICKDLRRRVRTVAWGDLYIRFDTFGEARDRVEVSASAFDNDGLVLSASVDNIKLDDVRARLGVYEARVVAMLQVGLEART